MRMVTVPRDLLINCCLTLSMFRRKGSMDPRETARQSMQAAVHRALHQAADEPAGVDPDSALNLLRAALDYCDTEGVPHSDVVMTVNSHARRGLPQRGAAAGEELRA